MFCLTVIEFLCKRDRIVMSAGIHVRYHVSVLTECPLNSSPVLTGRLQISLLILSKFQQCNYLLSLIKSLEKPGIPEKRDPGPWEDLGPRTLGGPRVLLGSCVLIGSWVPFFRYARKSTVFWWFLGEWIEVNWLRFG